MPANYSIFLDFQFKKVSFIEWLFLFFVKEKRHISNDQEIMQDVMLVYKEMWGHYYFIDCVVLPPSHSNCRYAFVERFEKEVIDDWYKKDLFPHKPEVNILHTRISEDDLKKR